MTSPNDIDTLRRDGLREVATIGAGHAATALSQLTNRRIMISVPYVHRMHYGEVRTRQVDGHTPNRPRNQREKALRLAKPAKSATELSERSRLDSVRVTTSTRTASTIAEKVNCSYASRRCKVRRSTPSCSATSSTVQRPEASCSQTSSRTLSAVLALGRTSRASRCWRA